MKKSVSIRVLCLVIALMVLSGAVAFAAVMGSPYETLKKAILDALTYRNVTEESTVTITLNGEVLVEQKSHSVTGDNAILDYYYNEGSGEADSFSYHSDTLSVNLGYTGYTGYTGEDGVTWYFASVYPHDVYFSGRNNGSFAVLNPEDRDSSQMRFLELVVDALVGDLKNNITMTSGDGVRLIQGTLTESQVPALAKAGLDMIVDQSSWFFSHNERDISFDGKMRVFEDININRDKKTVTTYKQAVHLMTPEEEEAWENGTIYDDMYNGFWGFTYKDGLTYVNEGDRVYVSEYTAPVTRDDYNGNAPLEIPMKSITINYVHGEAEVDADGNLLSLDIGAAATLTDVFGTVNKVEIKITARFSDIGTSAPTCPIPGVEQLLTPEYMKAHFGNEWDYLSVYFTLNDDGSINANSVTTTYPGEMDKPMDKPAEGMATDSYYDSYPNPDFDPFTTTHTQVIDLPEDR